MPEPRTSSGKGLPGFSVRKESHRSNHSGQNAESGPTGRRDGMGWVKGSGEQPPLTERRAAEFAWAAKHLPAEHPGLVVSALIGLEVAGQKRSTATVMARLEGQGRTMTQMKAKGWA